MYAAASAAAAITAVTTKAWRRVTAAGDTPYLFFLVLRACHRRIAAVQYYLVDIL